MSKEKLNIVDEDDVVIGTKERKIIHSKGLLHREVHVYFVTPENEIIFQHRAKDKETFPDLLDATVGGHVEIGEGYEEAALKETEEETGVLLDRSNLIPIIKYRKTSKDAVTNTINYAFGQVFIYSFNGQIADLKIEAGKGLGFEAWSFEKLLNLTDLEKAKFIPNVYDFVVTSLIKFIK